MLSAMKVEYYTQTLKAVHISNSTVLVQASWAAGSLTSTCGHYCVVLSLNLRCHLKLNAIMV